MNHFSKLNLKTILAAFFSVTLFAATALAQTTVFTYQGRLTDGSVAANGSYDLEFRLFDAAGEPIGGAQTRDDVQVSNGVFTVVLDAALFAANAFDGGSRLLEISVRRGNETGAFTVLAPRQPVTSAPYSIQSVNATTAVTAQNAQNLGNQPASQYVQTDDARLSDSRAPAAGSNFYIQNATAPQASSNFNVSGDGTAGGTLSANAVNSATAYNIGGSRVLSVAGINNLFAGINAGTATTGDGNSFVGSSAGANNTRGSANSFVGRSAGAGNTTGNFNTLIGNAANVGSGDLSFATAIGGGAIVRTSNTIVLGRETGNDLVRIFSFGAAGLVELCRNRDNEISNCSSSLRYKRNVAPFSFGLNLVNRLQPITFDWINGGMKDLGFGAEQVERVEPLLVTYNKAGEVEGVKYDRITAVLVNAVKEQQAQIERQQEQMKNQQALIGGLRRLVCSQNPQAEVCKEK